MIAYRFLLLLYPLAFRRRYGPEMTEAFARLLERTRAEEGLAGVALLWVRTTADAIASGLSERLATLAFSVSQRVREFGIRMAVGADQGSVLRSVLGEGLLLVAVALALGVAASAVLGRFLSGLLYQVDPLDPASMAMAASVLGMVALGAALMPALRATRIHPSEALRGE